MSCRDIILNDIIVYDIKTFILWNMDACVSFRPTHIKYPSMRDFTFRKHLNIKHLEVE